MDVFQASLCAMHGIGDMSRQHQQLRVPGFVREHAGIDADLAQRADVFLLDVAAEDQIRIGIAMQPAIALDLGLELARRPAGIAEREDGVLGAGALGDGACRMSTVAVRQIPSSIRSVAFSM